MPRSFIGTPTQPLVLDDDLLDLDPCSRDHELATAQPLFLGHIGMFPPSPHLLRADHLDTPHFLNLYCFFIFLPRIPDT